MEELLEQLELAIIRREALCDELRQMHNKVIALEKIIALKAKETKNQPPIS